MMHVTPADSTECRDSRPLVGSKISIPCLAPSAGAGNTPATKDGRAGAMHKAQEALVLAGHGAAQHWSTPSFARSVPADFVTDSLLPQERYPIS
jgi:hypothetical protein